MVHEFKPCVGLCAHSAEPAWDSLPPVLSAPQYCAYALSLKINNLKTKNKHKRVNSNVSYDFGVIIMCLCGFTSCNKYTTLVGDIDNRGGYLCMGAGGTLEFLHFPLNFAMNLKL